MSKKIRRSRNIESADVGLVKDVIWKKPLRNRDTALLCSIRKSLIKKIPGLAEEFNKQSRYFGYWTGEEKDRVYIYVQKKKLVIDLCVSSDFAPTLEKQGFKIKPRDNFQGNNGWLTGWQVPHSNKDINTIINWIEKAFQEN